jgi:hypothetical protein
MRALFAIPISIVFFMPFYSPSGTMPTSTAVTNDGGKRNAFLYLPNKIIQKNILPYLSQKDRGCPPWSPSWTTGATPPPTR